MPKFTLALALSVTLFVFATGCQAILPTAQLLGQAGMEMAQSQPMVANEAAAVDMTPTPTATSTAEVAEEVAEATAEPTQVPTEEPTQLPTEVPTVTPTLEPTQEPTEAAVEEATAEATEEPAEEPTEAATEEPAEEPTEAATEEPAEEATVEPTEEPAEEVTETITETTDVAPTAPLTESTTLSETAAMTETADIDLEEAAEGDAAGAESTDPVEVPSPDEQLPVVDTATILVRSLRIRSGPGTGFDVVGAAAAGEEYLVTGQAVGCQWYQIAHPTLGSVWIAGGDFSVAAGECTAIPEVAVAGVESAAGTPDVTPTSDGDGGSDEADTPADADDDTGTTPNILQPTPVPTTEETTDTATPEPTAVPEPTATAVPAEPATEEPAEETAENTDATDPFPADQGCLLLQNQLGPELTFTFTGTDNGFSDTVAVNSDADVPYCLAPGRYTVTVDAPPPWADINEEFTLNAGDRFFFPIRPQ